MAVASCAAGQLCFAATFSNFKTLDIRGCRTGNCKTERFCSRLGRNEMNRSFASPLLSSLLSRRTAGSLAARASRRAQEVGRGRDQTVLDTGYMKLQDGVSHV